jgi:hypothetical protein
MTLSVGDRLDLTLDVTVMQVNNGRARLQIKTDNGTIVRFWYGAERMEISPSVREHDPLARTETRSRLSRRGGGA